MPGKPWCPSCPCPRRTFGSMPFSIVADPQPKLPLAIMDFDFDATRVCVPECIAHRLDCNPVGRVPEGRSEVPLCAFHMPLKVGTAAQGGLDRPGAIQRRLFKSFHV